MNCKCHWVEAVLAIIIILFAYMERTSSKWVIIIASLILLAHALFCKKCQMCEEDHMVSQKAPKRRHR